MALASCLLTFSLQDSRLASRKYARIIQKLGFNAKFTDFKIQNIVGSCDIKFPIRLEGLASRHHHFSSYEPELFPGLVSLSKDCPNIAAFCHAANAYSAPVLDLSYDQAEDCAAHIRQRQDCLDWCKSPRGNLPGVRDDLPCAERYASNTISRIIVAHTNRFPQGLIQLAGNIRPCG